MSNFKSKCCDAKIIFKGVVAECAACHDFVDRHDIEKSSEGNIKTLKSKCCNAIVNTVGSPDFSEMGDTEISTMHWECFKCKQPCDAYEAFKVGDRVRGKREYSHYIGTITAINDFKTVEIIFDKYPGKYFWYVNNLEKLPEEKKAAMSAVKTLRDEFAIAALPSVILMCAERNKYLGDVDVPLFLIEPITNFAYKCADLMLQEREKYKNE